MRALGLVLALAMFTLAVSHAAAREDYLFDSNGNYWDPAWQAWRDPVDWNIWRDPYWMDAETGALWIDGQWRQPAASGVERWRPLVAELFPAWAVEGVLRVMQCESGGDPWATGAAGERGLMQIAPLHADSTYDPRGNLLAAYRISGGGASWAAWSCRP